MSIKQIPEKSDGDIKGTAREVSANLQPSLPKQDDVIEKEVADLEMPRSSLYRTVMFGLTSGTTTWMCTFQPPIRIGRAEYFRVPFKTNPLVDARNIDSTAIGGEKRL